MRQKGKKFTGYLRHFHDVLRRITDTPDHVTINERRLVQILHDWLAGAVDTPPWLYKVELGTLPQDHEGIDVVATSDAGPLFLQVKSSDIYAQQFTVKVARLIDQGHRLPITRVVIVNDKLDDHEILVATQRALKELREEVQRRGSSYLPPHHKSSRRNGTTNN